MRGYTAGHYTASFVALFPAEHPQYVMLVKLDDPPRQYFGGKAAAPVSKLVIEAALASRDASLDREALAAESLNRCVTRPSAIAHRPSPLQRLRYLPRQSDGRWPMADGRLGRGLRHRHQRAFDASRAHRPHAVPAVKGLSIRAAVLALHRAGFRVAGRERRRVRVGYGAGGRCRAQVGRDRPRRERAVKPFATARVADALKRAGLLVEITGALPERAGDITDDSRAVTTGAMFIAVKGSMQDGHEYLEDAAGRGASVAIVEQPGRTALPSIVVREGRRAAAIAAAAAFEEPANALRIAAVTGTNGKTTTVGILRHLLDAPGARSASIGTLGVLLGSAGTPVEGGAGLTTPGPVELQRVLRALVDQGVRSVAMEVSSHSLDQRRIDGLQFEAAVFTNLTRDHLDYHGTMDAYFAAKARLIEYLTPRGAAVINGDDPGVGAAAARALRHHVRARAPGDRARRSGALPAARQRVAAVRGHAASRAPPAAHRRFQRAQRAGRGGRGVALGVDLQRDRRAAAHGAAGAGPPRSHPRMSHRAARLRAYARRARARARGGASVHAPEADRGVRLRRRSRPRQAPHHGCDRREQRRHA